MRISIILLILIAGVITPAGAQRIAGPREGSALVVTRAESSTRHEALSRVPETHWRRGAVIGGLLGAAAWVAFAASLEPADPGQPSNLSVAVVGAPVFFLVAALPGALIGGLFPKGE